MRLPWYALIDLQLGPEMCSERLESRFLMEMKLVPGPGPSLGTELQPGWTQFWLPGYTPTPSLAGLHHAAEGGSPAVR